MAVWIDPPMWPAHGRLWSHVVSDTSMEELHEFARRAGIPARSFEGDHYDVPAERHATAVAAGALPTTANDLARRLRGSGLRYAKRRGERPLARVVDGLSAVGGPHVLDVVASPLEAPATAGAAVVVVREPGGRLVLVRSVARPGWAPPGGKRDLGETVREAAVREVAEETGLLVPPALLQPIGYERITIAPGSERAPWDGGENHIAVFAVDLPERYPVRPLAQDVSDAEWVDVEEAEARCGHEPWWVLVRHWLGDQR